MLPEYMTHTLFAGNDNDVRLRRLKQNGVAVTDATIELRLYPEDDLLATAEEYDAETPLPTTGGFSWPVMFNLMPTGDYLGVIPMDKVTVALNAQTVAVVKMTRPTGEYGSFVQRMTIRPRRG